MSQLDDGLADGRDLRGESSRVRRCTHAWMADGCSVGRLVFFALAGTIGG
ncbi:MULTISPECIES: hypothetical protein [unclassified Streptomyces]|nr:MULTISPECIES: hypothetical protein [unclassified Streptomyces]